jgi:hypothetical protein
MRGGGLYSADLDNSGTVDLIYVAYTGGNGLAPPMHVLTLLFDKTGRPVPSEMDGHFEIDEHGLQGLIDLDGDGRAELIRQAFDDGYWITSAYEARDAHWHRISVQHAARTFPIYTRFTNRANRVPTTPAPARHPIEDDLSNDTTAHSGRLTAVHWANVSQSESPQLDLSDGTICPRSHGIRAWSWSGILRTGGTQQHLEHPKKHTDFLTGSCRPKLAWR